MISNFTGVYSCFLAVIDRSVHERNGDMAHAYTSGCRSIADVIARIEINC